MVELNPRYWYEDERGQIQKYYYCKLCGSGPYKFEENGFKFKFYGLKDKDVYCSSCEKNHGFFRTHKLSTLE